MSQNRNIASLILPSSLSPQPEKSPMFTFSFSRYTGLTAVLALFVMPVHAADRSELSQLLVKKGIITEQELKALDGGVALEQLLFEKGFLTLDEMKSVQGQAEQEAAGSSLPAVIEEKNLSLSGNPTAKTEKTSVETGYGKNGFFMKSRDGNSAMNLQWRAQMRYTNPYRSDPRQAGNFSAIDQSTFELRRVRMKIGGHGYRSWLKYYFETDLQPTRDSSSDSAEGSARLIDWRLTLDKYDWLSLRVGQWKVNYNRERVDSSGRQTFVERSIVNRIFSVDRQMGVMAFGRLFPGTLGDTRYYLGAFNGEGRGVGNDDSNMMYMGRLQWNFLGRDLKWRQSDVGYSEQAAGSIALAGATNIGKCTRWSSSGCGNLDGFAKVDAAIEGQFKIQQMVAETAFKWHGFAWQQEFHWKEIADRTNGTKSDLKGGYAQAGYFFHNSIPRIPENLEVAFRYAAVDEPNETDIGLTNTRQEFSGAINYFIRGHNNKLTLDFSHLTLDDEFLNRKTSSQRVRFQWDVSF